MRMQAKAMGKNDNHIVLIDLCVQFIYKTVLILHPHLYASLDTFTSSFTCISVSVVCKSNHNCKKSSIALKFSCCVGCCLCLKLYMCCALPQKKKTHAAESNIFHLSNYDVHDFESVNGFLHRIELKRSETSGMLNSRKVINHA